METFKNMNLPNKLTCLRVVMIPFFCLFLLLPAEGRALRIIALILFILASATDWADGYLARKYHLVTNFGKFMDPLADKLLVCSAMICLLAKGDMPAWIVIIIIAREFIISGFRLVASDAGIVIAANMWGKAKTVSQILMICLLIIDFDGAGHVIANIVMYVALILTVISLVVYIRDNIRVITEGGM